MDGLIRLNESRSVHQGMCILRLNTVKKDSVLHGTYTTV